MRQVKKTFPTFSTRKKKRSWSSIRARRAGDHRRVVRLAPSTLLVLEASYPIRENPSLHFLVTFTFSLYEVPSPFPHHTVGIA